MADFDYFLHAAFVGFITLFPVIDPIGTAFIVNPYFGRLPKEERRPLVRKIAIYCLLISASTLFLGHWVLTLFGLSIAIVKLAGGIMIAKMGWDSLSSATRPPRASALVGSESIDAPSPQTTVESELLYPISFPLTVGPGSISVLLTLSAHGYHESHLHYVLSTAGLLSAAAAMSVLIYVLYLKTGDLVTRLGDRYQNMINRLMAFLIFAVGLQIAAGGLQQLTH